MFHTTFTQPNNGLDKHNGEISGLGTGENRANWSRTRHAWDTPLCHNFAEVTFPATPSTTTQVLEFARRRRRGKEQREEADDKGKIGIVRIVSREVRGTFRQHRIGARPILFRGFGASASTH